MNNQFNICIIFILYLLFFFFNNIATAAPCDSSQPPTFSITNSRLNLPCVEVPNASGKSDAYKVDMQFTPTSKNPLLFTFKNVSIIDGTTRTNSSPDPKNTELCQDFAASFPATKGTAPVGNHWLYQLQNAKISDIVATKFDLLTIDYSRDGSDEASYSKQDIQTLHDNKKIVLAYLSIGEAEEYRYYFKVNWLTKTSSGILQPSQSAPCWLGQTNKDWHGNYKTQYWSEAWQQILLGYLDKIIDAGFDGVYLDITDAYEYWSDKNNGEGFYLEIFYIALRMIDLVKRIAYHARVVRKKPNFFVFPQNGEAILEFDRDGSYLQTISGIGIEDLFYYDTDPVPDSTVGERMDFLIKIQAVGKKVMVVDYIDDGSGYTAKNKTRIDDFLSKTLDENYIPYVGRLDRELSTINRINAVQ